MRIVGLIILFAAEMLRANTIFYNVNFNADKVNEPPAVDLGTNSPCTVDSAIVVRSFGQLANKPLLLSDGGLVDFQLARGTLDYTLDFDFQAHYLDTNDYFFFDISFGQIFEFSQSGQMMISGEQTFPLEWNDGQAHHLHMVIGAGNSTNHPWSVQLDNNEPISGANPYVNPDPTALDISLRAYSTNSQVAIDNIVVGTTTNCVPLSPILSSYDSTFGNAPEDRVARDVAGNIYGTAFLGTDPVSGGDLGTVFKSDKTGKLIWVFHFNYANGGNPHGGVIIGDDGFLYGTTLGGGLGFGTVFKMSRNGELIWSVPFNGTNGQAPRAGVIEIPNQQGEIELYGTTLNGGAQGNGTVFKLDASRNIHVLYSFTNGADGALPSCRPVPGDDGYLYGTTSDGNGTIFKVSRNGNFTNLFTFDGTNDGCVPHAGLVKYGKDTFYGTTFGGANFEGSVFCITGSGAFTNLHSFGPREEGVYSESELVLGSDGKLYGTTVSGGSGDFGTVFRMSPAGDFQKLADFHGGDGSYPSGAMIEAEHGKFYGVTVETGGFPAADGGGVFSLSAMRPILVIAQPSPATISKGGELEITGKTRCDPPVTNVSYQINGGGWLPANTTNAWLTWFGTAAVAPGTNIVQAYAVSAFGDRSRTNTLRFVR